MHLNRHALRVIRERSGLSVSGLARRAGLSQPHLSNIESGKRQASAGSIRAIADALGVPLLALLDTDDDGDRRAGGDDPVDGPLMFRC